MSKYKILNSAGITAAIGLASLPAFLTLAPAVSHGAVHAETTETLGTSATISSTLGLSVSSINLNINPSSNGAVFKTGKTIATVSTNNQTGYTLYLADSDGDSALNHKTLANTAITSTLSDSTGSAMQANTWGYTLGSSETEGEDEVDNATNLALTYSPIPTVRATLKRTDAAVTTESTPVTFGVKVNTEIPSGVYSDQVSITAVPNYNSDIYDNSRLWLNGNGVQITTMQEMTPEVCASVPTPSALATGSNVPEITLTDTRNSKPYKVRKLADGNCWMVESLAIENRTGDNKLTSADSNVTTAFELPAATASSGTTGNEVAARVANDGVNGTYLYNWLAATAGTGTAELKDANASGDICPKGWQLPNSDGNMSWNRLLRQGQGVYEVATDSNTYTNTKVSWGSYSGLSNKDNNPIGLQLTGAFYSAAQQATENGHYWTRTAHPSVATNAYTLDLTKTNIYSRGSGNFKILGFAVRCVAKNPVTPATATYMQDVEACPASLPLERKYTLKDKRDEKEYTVARLADGNCWMTSSLAIENQELEPTKSNVTTNFTLPAATASSGTVSTMTEAQVANDGMNNTYLYNWFAATAGSGTQSLTSGNAPQDICPKGWQLPNSEGNKSWNRLLRVGQNGYEVADGSNNYTNAKANWGSYAGISYRKNNPLGLQFTSFFLQSELFGFYEGYYWSRTADSANQAFHMGYYSERINPQYSNSKNMGFAVRCVFK